MVPEEYLIGQIIAFKIFLQIQEAKSKSQEHKLVQWDTIAVGMMMLT